MLVVIWDRKINCKEFIRQVLKILVGDSKLGSEKDREVRSWEICCALCLMS